MILAARPRSLTRRSTGSIWLNVANRGFQRTWPNLHHLTGVTKRTDKTDLPRQQVNWEGQCALDTFARDQRRVALRRYSDPYLASGNKFLNECNSALAIWPTSMSR